MDGIGDSEQSRPPRLFAGVCEITSNSIKIGKKKGRDSPKKGFSNEQIKSLETMFESETKPESKKKVEIATELGLQPRQVAIWFQNRRARWKSKQLEKDYGILKASYDRLAAEYEALQKEKHELLLEVQRLRVKLVETEPPEEYCRQHDSSHENCEGQPNVARRNSEDSSWDVPITPRSFFGNSVGDRLRLLNMKKEEVLEEDEDGSLELLSFHSTDTSDYSLSGTAWWSFWT
ncbi:hypothetical protein SAY86_028932 [Trapa natans]|uniref:Homeobox-leucine zipper protein n=1 Tax=Trapa natans TaxID=22666 RepID=A0AAN7REX8_TRANT|nr:hypothetical protein SAY86_028932 [Trapa natans]